MNNETAAKIAKALGYRDGGEDHWFIDIDLIPKERVDYIENMHGWQAEYMAGNESAEDDSAYWEGWFVERDMFERLLGQDDPLLQQRVRDRVRELWCKGTEGKYPWQDIDITIGTKRYLLMLMRYWWSGEHTEDQCFYTETDTESAAWAAALLWLAERGKW